MKKTFLLDTNIVMKYPNAIMGFDDNNVVMTATSIEELDNLKNLSGDRSSSGADARAAIRSIDRIRNLAKKQNTTLSKGVVINDKGGTFRLENNHIDDNALPQGWDIRKADNRIIACAKNIGAVLVTEDKAMAIKADELEIPVESYRNAEVTDDEVYTGHDEIYVPAEDIAVFYSDRRLKFKKKYGRKNMPVEENEYFVVHNSNDPSKTILARYTQGYLVPLVTLPQSCNINPRNVYQEFMIDMFMNRDIDLAIVSGEAGAAKTFFTVVAGMQGYMHDMWSQMICTRNNVEMDSHGIGALPGDEIEKIGPLMRGVCDNLRTYLLLQGTDEKDIKQIMNDYIESEIIKFEAMSFMRGRSITNSLLFLDECQNATPHQIHSIVTRAASGTKVICCGDPGQIDDIKLDKKNNGLAFIMKHMRDCNRTAQLIVDDPSALQRSEIAKLATERMSGAFM